jgi:hypothetical protein
MNTRIMIVVFGCMASAAVVWAQVPPPAPQSLAATLNVYVFPSKGQTPSQQSQDESACYQWAVGNTGVDPFQAQKQAQAQAQQAQAQEQQVAQSSKGAGARGALGGAAVGALVGEIADDNAGKGAAWGAALGGISARRRAKASEQQATQQIQAQSQQAQAASQTEIENFKKAFSVCLEAKNYMVKY